MKSSKRLTREEEVALFMAGKTDAVVEAHLDLVRGVAGRYSKGRPALFDDLVQQGCLGLLFAAKRFDVSKGNRFFTYAEHWVKNFVTDWLRATRRLVVIPKSSVAHRASAAMAAGEIGTAEELSKAANVSDHAESLFNLLASRELSEFRYNDEGESYEWLTSDHNQEELYLAAVAGVERKAMIADAMVGLLNQERVIVNGMILSDDPVLGTEMGLRLGISRQRVNQVLQSALRKIAQQLRPGWEGRVRVVTNAEPTKPPQIDDEYKHKTGSKLTRKEAAAIRAAIARGVRPRDVADRYSITIQSVRNVAAGRTWPEVA